ncbi:Rha family transcriptional regulator [Romboutsia sp. 1001713B170207_170306_H8]|uniref:Rha family transcriptional regulator n=1 Tax=Romboutsia sp. 1001713B170207_170306_H8 TaxID=2787112 RepID=UPI00189A26E7|nr:Rha family transcriptional regulator [Romboutsia sp. 1001713B170207_170306_H8]
MQLKLVDKTEVKKIVNIQELDGVLLVSSREIATHFEKRHSDVIDKIEELIKAENSVMSMFIGSTYKAGTGKNYKEYLMNRDGFSLLVMGFTGSKALTWKLKYIEAFNKMEEQLKNPFSNMSKELQAILMVDKKQQEQEKRIADIENKMTINYELAENLRTAINYRAIELLGGKNTPAYRKLNKKLFSAFYKDIRRTFNVNSYKNLSVKNYDLAMDYIRTWKVDEILKYAIQGVNSQLVFEVN